MSKKNKNKSKHIVNVVLGMIMAAIIVCLALIVLICAYLFGFFTPQSSVSSAEETVSQAVSSEDATDAREYFAGKVWLVIGDSLSLPNVVTEKSYVDYVAEWLGVEVINLAKSGTGYTRAFNGNTSWLDAMDTYPDPDDVDFITILGALNDFEIELGNFGDADTSTMYGSLFTYYYNLTKKYPDTPIGVITSPPRAISWGETGNYIGHINAVTEIAQAYSLPVLDLYRTSDLLIWYYEDKEDYFSYEGSPEGDGTHLNSEGQLLIANKIYDFIVNNLNVYRT